MFLTPTSLTISVCMLSSCISQINSLDMLDLPFSISPNLLQLHVCFSCYRILFLFSSYTLLLNQQKQMCAPASAVIHQCQPQHHQHGNYRNKMPASSTGADIANNARKAFVKMVSLGMRWSSSVRASKLCKLHAIVWLPYDLMLRLSKQDIKQHSQHQL